MIEQITEMEENIKRAKKGDFKVVLHRMEVIYRLVSLYWIHAVRTFIFINMIILNDIGDDWVIFYVFFLFQPYLLLPMSDRILKINVNTCSY